MCQLLVGVAVAAGAEVGSAGVYIAVPINPSKTPSGLRQLNPMPRDGAMPPSVESVTIVKTFEMINSPHSMETMMPKIENDFPGVPFAKMPMSSRTKPPRAERMPSPSRPLMLREMPRKPLVIVAQGIAAPTIRRMPEIRTSVFGFIV